MLNSIVIEAYRQVGIPVDQLPYCDSFVRLRNLVETLTGESINERSLWLQLLNLRKGGKLPRLVR